MEETFNSNYTGAGYDLQARQKQGIAIDSYHLPDLAGALF
jgi:hypothetical protein